MSEPATLTVGVIAALAFTKFLGSSAGEAAKKLTPLILEKEDVPLSQKIVELEKRLTALEAAIRCN